MIIENKDDLNFNIKIAKEANKAITGIGIIINPETLESTFSSCIYYNTTKLQCCSIVNKLAQNQSFEDGNKRTALAMLDYYINYFDLELIVTDPKKLAKIILDIATKHWTPEETCKTLFGTLE